MAVDIIPWMAPHSHEEPPAYMKWFPQLLNYHKDYEAQNKMTIER
jgi:hypothetical protein